MRDSSGNQLAPAPSARRVGAGNRQPRAAALHLRSMLLNAETHKQAGGC